MKLVRTGLADDVDDAASDLAILGQIIMGLDLELLNGFDDGRQRISAGERALVGEAVQYEEVTAVRLSVDCREREGAGVGSRLKAACDVLTVRVQRLANNAVMDLRQVRLVPEQKRAESRIGRSGGLTWGGHPCLPTKGQSPAWIPGPSAWRAPGVRACSFFFCRASTTPRWN